MQVLFLYRQVWANVKHVCLVADVLNSGGFTSNGTRSLTLLIEGNVGRKTYLRYMGVFFPKWTCLHLSCLYLQFEGYWTGARWRPDDSQRCFSVVFSNRLLVNATAHRKSNKNCGRRLPSFPPVCSLMGRKGQSMAIGNVWEFSGEYGS